MMDKVRKGIFNFIIAFAVLAVATVSVTTGTAKEVAASGATRPSGKSLDEVSVVEIVSPEADDTAYVEVEWPDYDDWDVVTLEGKLKMKILPLSPSVKIFMQNNALISASLRAPFLGEVGRLEVTPEKLLIVNKMNKTYVEEDLRGRGVIGDKILGIKEVQDLLLGRFFLPGIDIKTANLDEMVDIFYEEDQFNVIPKGIAEIDGVKYGFAVDQQFNPILLVVMPNGEASADLEVSAEYVRNLTGYNLTLAYSQGSQGMEMTFEFKNPVWSGEVPKSINVEKYRRVGFVEFMRSGF